MKFIDSKIVYEGGDWVVVLDTEYTRNHNMDMIGYIFQIKPNYNSSLLESFNKGGSTSLDPINKYGLNYHQPDIRPATQAEIDAVSKPKFKVGDWITVIKNIYEYDYVDKEIGKTFQIKSYNKPNEFGIDCWYVKDDLSLCENNFRLATSDEIKKAQIKVEPIVIQPGSIVKLKNKRGDGWNTNGEMDRYLNRVVMITRAPDYRRGFEIKQDKAGGHDTSVTWTFNNSDIERMATKEEIKEFNKFKVGDWVTCIPGGKRIGAGYQDNLTYMATSVDSYSDIIVFGGRNSDGVYSDSLRFALSDEIERAKKAKQNELGMLGKHKVEFKNGIIEIGCVKMPLGDAKDLLRLMFTHNIAKITHSDGTEVTEPKVRELLNKIQA